MRRLDQHGQRSRAVQTIEFWPDGTAHYDDGGRQPVAD